MISPDGQEAMDALREAAAKWAEFVSRATTSPLKSITIRFDTIRPPFIKWEYVDPDAQSR